MKINEGLLYGYGIFETIKVVNREPINLLEHFNRMKNSSKELNINLNLDFKKFEKKIKDKVNKFSEGKFVLRVNVLKNKEDSNIIFNKRKFNYTNEMYELGFKLTFSNILKNETSKIVYHKTLNYLENLMELNRIRKDGYDEIIFLNTRGYIGECATSNIFIVKDEKIYTPKIENGILNGIIREKVISQCGSIGIEIYEKNINKEFLLNGDEIFITNSLMEIMPVSKIDKFKYKMETVNKIKKILSF